MTDLNIIDQFLAVFIRYIDSGFGLVQGDVHHLASILIALDVTLAGLFWALDGSDDVLARLIRKVMFVGSFAFLIEQFHTLADIIFQSFARLGLTAGGGSLTADQLLQPGHVAGVGFAAAWPLLNQASQMMGVTSFFENFVEIVVLMLAWLAVIAAFFVLSVQMFVTVLEFKLATLGGFILVPFALWNRTSFLAERVLGHVVASGIKIMILGIIVGIGTGFFDQFVGALSGKDPDIAQAATLALASLTLLGLGIFGPGVASGLVNGGPQLGAGSVVGTAALAGAGVGVVAGGARLLVSGGLSAIRAASAMPVGSATRSLSPNSEGDRPPTPGSAAGSATPNSSEGHAPEERDRGTSTNDQMEAPTAAADTTARSSREPAWAQQFRRTQVMRQRQQLLIQTLREGESRGGGPTPNLGEKE